MRKSYLFNENLSFIVLQNAYKHQIVQIMDTISKGSTLLCLHTYKETIFLIINAIANI